ncbi:MAG: class I SAM-dependent methyltransferase [Armatimonadetes bacterium]|nr:class I SAM-dependent methyltransferase [Armatimonadota bacterium]
MASVPYEAWVDYVLRLMKQFEGQGGRALDVACGTGNVSFALHRRGYQVAGADASEDMLAYARAKAEEKSIDIPFYHQDMRALALEDSFDLAVCLFDSLNYLLTAEDVQAVCAGVAKHLNPGGLFIFDVNTRYALEKGFFDQSNLDSRHGPLYVWKSTFDAETRICQVAMNFMPDSQDLASQFQEIHCQKAHTVLELTAALQKAGLSVLAVYDAFTTSKPRARSDRLHFVARK